jgi:hypothetical protein
VKGERIDGASSRNRGTIIVHGDVTFEMQKAPTDQVAIQAQNISIKVIENFITNGVIRPMAVPDEIIIQMPGLRTLAQALGMIINENQLDQLQTTSGDTLSEDGSGGSVAVRDADECGFIGEWPTNGLFITTLPNDLLRSILPWYLRRYMYGRL